MKLEEAGVLGTGVPVRHGIGDGTEEFPWWPQSVIMTPSMYVTSCWMCFGLILLPWGWKHFFDAALKPCSYYQVMGETHGSILILISGPTPHP